MKPYSYKKNPKGISSRRKSKKSLSRTDSLRVDKKAIRQNNDFCDACNMVWYNCLCSHDDDDGC